MNSLFRTLFDISGRKVIVLLDEYNSNLVQKFLSWKNKADSKY